MPDCVARVLSGGGAVLSPLTVGVSAYEDELRATLHEIEELDISAFHGFTEEEVDRCLERSNVIECAAGDHVLKKGGAARNVFVVLDGTLEVGEDGQAVGVL